MESNKCIQGRSLLRKLLLLLLLAEDAVVPYVAGEVEVVGASLVELLLMILLLVPLSHLHNVK
jgi:hypothetical protein